MKIIIQCSGRKKDVYWTYENKKIKFVAHPHFCEESESVIYCHPDEMVPKSNITWRKKLVDYNHQNNNPDGLLKAGDLYSPEIYSTLVNKYGFENIYILSAGWGLVRTDFLLSAYDITFKATADQCNRRRYSKDTLKDFNQLKKNITNDETIYFFGGVGYLSFLYDLVDFHQGRKVIYFKARNIDRREGYEYIEYITSRLTNWHYSCAKDFIEGNIEK